MHKNRLLAAALLLGMALVFYQKPLTPPFTSKGAVFEHLLFQLLGAYGLTYFCILIALVCFAFALKK